MKLFFRNVRADMDRYIEDGGWYKNLGFWVILVYRFGSFARRIQSVFLRYPLLVLYKILAIPIQFFLHVHIPTQMKIGPGFKLPHPYLILFPPRSVIGDSCTIYHNVTLGYGSAPGVPVLDDNVVVFTGARVLGGVAIGRHVHIGANTVVMRDVESGGMASPPTCRFVPGSMHKAILKSKSEHID